MINRKEVNKYIYDNFIYEKDKYKMSVIIATLLKNIAITNNCMVLSLGYNNEIINFMLSNGVEEERFRYNINSIIRYKKLNKILSNDK